MKKGAGTKASPWVLTTPSESSEYQMYKDDLPHASTVPSAAGFNPKNNRMRAK